GCGVDSVGEMRYRRVTAPLLCLEGRADGLSKDNIAAVSAHGAAASFQLWGIRLSGKMRNAGKFRAYFPSLIPAAICSWYFLIALRMVLSSGVFFSGCNSLAKSPHFCSNSSNVWRGPCCNT